MLIKFLIISFISSLGILNLFYGFAFSDNAQSKWLAFLNKKEKNEAVLKKESDNKAVSPYLFPVNESNYPIRDWSVDDLNVNGRSAIIYDLHSEKILLSKDIDKRLPIASLTKLMTAVVVLENINLDDVVEIKEAAIKKSEELGGGRDLFIGEKIKASDLLKIMLIESSNDAAYAFEEHMRDSYGINLVKLMNKKAIKLKMYNSYFTEPAGLDDENSFSTVSDLVKLVKYSLRYKNLFDILRTPETEVVSIDGKLKHKIFNTNKLLGVLLNIIGGKTGFTELAGGSMILVTKSPGINDSKLVTIILGSNDRFGEVEKMVKWAEKAYLWK